MSVSSHNHHIHGHEVNSLVCDSMKIKMTLLEKRFLTSDQIIDIFGKNDITSEFLYTINRVIADVDQQYAKIPMDMPINEYLYQTLMSIEDIDSANRCQNVVENIGDTLDGEDVSIISYNDFCEKVGSLDGVSSRIEKYIMTGIKDFFVVYIEKDVTLNKKTKNCKRNITSRFIQNYINYFSVEGINFYVFVNKDGSKNIVVGTQKGTTGTSNDVFFGDLAKKYNITNVTIPLSHFIKEFSSKKENI